MCFTQLILGLILGSVFPILAFVVELVEFPGDGRQRLPLCLRQNQADVQSRQQADHRKRHKTECTEPTLEKKGNIMNINLLEQPVCPPFVFIETFSEFCSTL